jgi:hypothetical protein
VLVPRGTEILEAARFADIAFTDVREPVYYGPDVAAALDWVDHFTFTGEALKGLDHDAAARAVGRLREALAAHASDDSVVRLPGLMITARRRLAFVRRGWLIPRMRPKSHASSLMSNSV